MIYRTPKLPLRALLAIATAVLATAVVALRGASEPHAPNGSRAGSPEPGAATAETAR